MKFPLEWRVGERKELFQFCTLVVTINVYGYCDTPIVYFLKTIEESGVFKLAHKVGGFLVALLHILSLL